MSDTVLHPSRPAGDADPTPGFPCARRDDQATALRRIIQQSQQPEDGAHVAPALAAILPPSTPTGAVSFRPRPQRTRLPARAASAPPPAAPDPGTPARSTAQYLRGPRLARAIAVTSGKGGVGKSNLAVNLAVVLSQMGRKVCLLDADLGMANVDVLCNLTPRETLLHVVTGRARLVDVMLLGPGGFRLIPGASGVAGMADLGARHRAVVLKQLAAVERVADDIIIDCAAGISANVLAFAAAAHTTVVTTTPEPTAVTDAYGMVKCLHRQAPETDLRLVVNMAEHEEEGHGVHERMDRVTRTFLGRSIGLGGWIPLDPAVATSVRYRLPFALAAPDGAATAAVRRIARRLVGIDDEARERRGFFARVASWFGSSESNGPDASSVGESG